MIETAFPSGWDLERSPFHPGELSVQARVGAVDRIDAQGRRVLRRHMTEQHRAFFGLLPYAFVGTVDAGGQPWASMLVGRPGFLRAPDPHRLEVSARPLFGDPLGETLRHQAEIALLGVELSTRRRNRVVGTVAEAGPDGFSIDVRQTLGLCSRYIQSRGVTLTADPFEPTPRTVNVAMTLDAAARAMVETADTFFVASVNPRDGDAVVAGADVSHRGGRPGFVRVDDEGTITAPEFIGNFMFNTLGNFELDDRAGLFFFDAMTGDTLHLAARAEVIWDGKDVAAFAGAERLVRYRLQTVIRVERALPLAFSAPDPSPMLSRTGTWREADAAIKGQPRRGG